MLSLSYLKDFYLLLSVQELCKGRESPRAWVKLADDTDTFLTHLSENLALAMRDYLILASFGESRHAIGSSGKKTCPRLINFSDGGLGRTGAMEDAVVFDPEKSLPKLIEIFNTPGNWTSPTSVGGKKWGTIAQAALYWYTDFKDKPIAFIDHCADVQHNNGTAFSKTEAADIMKDARMHEWGDGTWGSIRNFLAFKARSTPKQIVENVVPYTPKTYALVNRLFVLETWPDYRWSMPNRDSNVTYEPIEWGKEELEVIEKSEKCRDYTDKLRLGNMVKWKPYRPGTDVTSMSDEKLLAYIEKVELGKKFIDAALASVQPFVEQYPAFESQIKAMAVIRGTRSHAEYVKAKRETLADRYRQHKPEAWDKMLDEFQSATYEGVVQLTEAADWLQSKMKRIVHDHVIALNVPPMLQARVKMALFEDADKLANAAKDSYCVNLYGVDMMEYTTAYNRARQYASDFFGFQNEKLVTQAGNMRRDETLNKLYHSAKIALQSSLYFRSVECRTLAMKFLQEEYERRLERVKLEIQQRKEVMKAKKSMPDAPSSQEVLTPQQAYEKYLKTYHVPAEYTTGT